MNTRTTRTTWLEVGLAWIAAVGLTITAAIVAVIDVVRFAAGGGWAFAAWAVVAAAVAVAAGLWWRRLRGTATPRRQLGKVLLPVAAMTMVLSLGTSETALADCDVPGTHWHWRSSTDKFKSERSGFKTCWQRFNGTPGGEGGCTQWYNALNYAYICNVDITGICFWKYTGSISRHHSHGCRWY